MKTMAEAMKPAVTISRIFCMCPLRIRERIDVQRNQNFLGWVHLVLFVVIVCSSALYQLLTSSVEIEGTIEVISYYILRNIRFPGFFILIIVFNFKTKPAVIFAKTFDQIDEEMEAVGPGINFECLHSRIFCYTIITAFKMLVQFSLYITDGPLSPKMIIEFCAYGLPTFTTHVMMLNWFCAVQTITLYFKELNVILKSLKYRHCFVAEDFKCLKKVPASTTIKTCGNLFGMLCQQCITFSEALSLPLLWMISSEFVFATFHAYELMRMINGSTHFNSKIIAACVTHAMLFMDFILPCIFCVQETLKFEEILNKLDLMLNKNGYLNSIVNNVTIGCYQQRPSFSAYGVLSLNGNLLNTIIGSLLTYLVILLQFDD